MVKPVKSSKARPGPSSGTRFAPSQAYLDRLAAAALPTPAPIAVAAIEMTPVAARRAPTFDLIPNSVESRDRSRLSADRSPPAQPTWTHSLTNISSNVREQKASSLDWSHADLGAAQRSGHEWSTGAPQRHATFQAPPQHSSTVRYDSPYDPTIPALTAAGAVSTFPPRTSIDATYPTVPTYDPTIPSTFAIGVRITAMADEEQNSGSSDDESLRLQHRLVPQVYESLLHPSLKVAPLHPSVPAYLPPSSDEEDGSDDHEERVSDIFDFDVEDEAVIEPSAGKVQLPTLQLRAAKRMRLSSDGKSAQEEASRGESSTDTARQMLEDSQVSQRCLHLAPDEDVMMEQPESPGAGGLGDFSQVFDFMSAERETRLQLSLTKSMGSAGEEAALPAAGDYYQPLDTSLSTLFPPANPQKSTRPKDAKSRKKVKTKQRRKTGQVTYTDSDWPTNSIPDNMQLDYSDQASAGPSTPVERKARKVMVEEEFDGVDYTKDEIVLLPLVRASYQRRARSQPPLTVASSNIAVDSSTTIAVASLSTSSKSVYVRPASRLAYERNSITVDSLRQQSLPPRPFPLSSSAKAQSLPVKLALAFPDDDPAPFHSPKLYTPAIHAITTSINSLQVSPGQGVLNGFWPAPPPLNTGKGLYPAPIFIPEPVLAHEDLRSRVDVFVDNSNVVYSFLNWLRKQEGQSTAGVSIGGKKAKLDYTTLFAILERGRKVEKRILVGSSPLWQGLEAAIDWGYEVSILQRVPRLLNPVAPVRPSVATDSGNDSTPDHDQSRTAASRNPIVAPSRAMQYKEQAVDELLHMKILESLLDYTPPASTARPLLVLATGDANASEYNPTGFLGCVRRALVRGWDVEIVAWGFGTSDTWLGEETRAAAAADEMGDGIGQRGRLRIVDLQAFAEELVL